MSFFSKTPVAQVVIPQTAFLYSLLVKLIGLVIGGTWTNTGNVMKCHCNVSNIFLLLTPTLNARAVHKAKKSSRDFERKKKTEPFAKQMRNVASLTHCGNKIVLRCAGHIWPTGENSMQPHVDT